MAESKRVNLTMDRVKQLVPPATGRTVVYDAKVPGLIIRMTPTGAKSWYVYRRPKNGRPQRYHLGTFPEMGVADARQEAMVVVAKMTKGIDPQAERRAVQTEMLFKDAFSQYLELKAKPHRKTWKETERIFNTYLKPLHNRPLSSIKTMDVTTLHANLGKKHGHYMANRILAGVSAVFTWMISKGWEGRNPCSGIERFHEQSRDRFLNVEELKRFFKALAAEEEPMFKDYFLICLLTGVRGGNVRSMRWSDLELDRGLWRLPDTKAGGPLLVVLPLPAVTLLRKRKEMMEAEAKTESDTDEEPAIDYVFPETRARSKHGHMGYPQKAWERIQTRAGLPDLRIHDLRRTLGSWQAGTGASLPIIGRTLGHRDHTSTMIYARLDLDPVRRSVETATSTMLTLGDANMPGLLPPPAEQIVDTQQPEPKKRKRKPKAGANEPPPKSAPEATPVQ